jgi:hypothetical protein
MFLSLQTFYLLGIRKTTVGLRSMFGYNRNPISREAQQSLWVHLKLKRIGYWSIARSNRTRLMTLRSLGALAHLRSHETIRQTVTNHTVLRTKVPEILSYGYSMYTFPCSSLSHTCISSFMLLPPLASSSFAFLSSWNFRTILHLVKKIYLCHHFVCPHK